MIVVDEKIKEICERKKFTSFWEAFDYMKLANYSELESIMMAMKMFNGKIWDKVIFAKKMNNNKSNTNFSSGFTMTIVGDVDDNEEVLLDTGDSDDMDVKIFIMTPLADEIYLPVYKAYAETREYAPNVALEQCVKIITTTLTTELGIQLFNDWYNQQ